MHKHSNTPDTDQVDTRRASETLAILPIIPPLALVIVSFEWMVFVLTPTLLNQHTASYRPLLENVAFTAIGLVLNCAALIAMRAKHRVYMWLFLAGSFLLTLSF
jgi:hypothetical protein